jgi:hypothetical protein
MKQSEKITTLLESMVKAQKEFVTLPKDKEGYGYKYTDLDTVITTVRPILAKNNLGFMQSLTMIEGRPGITTRLFNTAGEWIEDTIALPDIAMAKTNAAQNMGAAITYMKRYALSAILGTSSDEDTDAATPQVPHQEQRQAPKQQPKAPGLAGGPDTKEEHETIKALLGATYPDKSPMFAEEKKKVEGWRKERTAAQVIEYLKAEQDKRMAEYFENAKATHDEAVGKREAMPEADEKGAEQAFEIF